MRPILGHPLLKLLLASTHKINFNFKQYKHKNNKNNHYIINYLSVLQSLIIYKISDTLLDIGVVMSSCHLSPTPLCLYVTETLNSK